MFNVLVRLGLAPERSNLKSPLPFRASSSISADLNVIFAGVPETLPDAMKRSYIGPACVLGGRVFIPVVAAKLRSDGMSALRSPSRLNPLLRAADPVKLPVT